MSPAGPRQPSSPCSTTSHPKEPIAGRVAIRRLNLDGDRQADLTVHGGPDKAVYAYPSEHYPYWQSVFPDAELSWARFGENLTTAGLLEDEIRIGDRFHVGAAELVVTQPRTPCYKLGIRFGCAKMVRLFLRSGRPGFYFAVAREGVVEAGDAITLIARDEDSLTVADIAGLYAGTTDDPELLRRAGHLTALPESWRDYFRAQDIRLSSA